MSRALDVEITRAMGELAEAAPLPRDVESLEPPGNEMPRRRGVLVLATTAAVVLIAGVVWAKASRDATSDVMLLSTPTPTSTPVSTPVEASTTSGAAPAVSEVDLPDGLVVWNVGEGLMRGRSQAEQLFGQLDPTGTRMERGLLVSAYALPDLGAIPPLDDSTVAIRGTRATVSTVAGISVIRWVENGIQFEVYSRTLSTEEVVSALDPMLLRGEGRVSFEPDSAPADLPLIVESESDPTHISRSTYFRLGPVDDPLANPMNFVDDPRITVSDWTTAFELPARIIALGEKQPDGSYEAPVSGYLPDQKPARYVLDPGRSVVTITGANAAQRQGILDSLPELMSTDRNTLRDSVSRRLSTLPELSRVSLPTGTIVLRGGTLDKPTALCLAIGAGESCRLDGFTNPMAPAAHAIADGTWYFFGIDTTFQQALVDCTHDWSDTTPAAAAVPRETVPAGDSTFWIAKIPDDATCIRSGRVEDGTVILEGSSGATARPS